MVRGLITAWGEFIALTIGAWEIADFLDLKDAIRPIISSNYAWLAAAFVVYGIGRAILYDAGERKSVAKFGDARARGKQKGAKKRKK